MPMPDHDFPTDPEKVSDCEQFLNDRRQDVFDVPKNVLGETMGFPNADGDGESPRVFALTADNPFADEEHGEEFTAEEVAERVNGFEKGVQAVKERRKTEETLCRIDPRS